MERVVNVTLLNSRYHLLLLRKIKNEIIRFFGHFCAHAEKIGPGEPPENGEMNEMTLPSRHKIQNSNPGGLRPSTLPLGHGDSSQYFYVKKFTSGWERNMFVSFKSPRQGNEPRALKAVVLIFIGPPARYSEAYTYLD